MSVRKGNKIIAGSYAVVKPEVYTKVETDDLLNQKQDKLIAGNNIFIDENNVISSSGGGGSLINVVQETGDSTEDVMSQASVTHELEQKANTIDLADVSLSGDYEDLSNTPDLSVYTKTEDLAEIAFTADYEDLGNTPDLSVYVKNEELSKVATTNNYNDLDNKPNLSLKQDLLTAGEGISIEGNTISSTVNSAEWGNIIGDIANQADLQEGLNGKLGIDFDNITEEGVKNLANIIGTGDYMFDTRLVDHELTYEESKGWALQGTYVYKEAVAGSRYGYPDFYAKCLEEYQDVNNTESIISTNVDIVGSLANNDGILSGFSASNYATLPNTFNPASNTWEQVWCFTTSSSVTTFQSIIGGVSGFANPLYRITSDGYIQMLCSTNNSSWDINITGNSVLTANTKYYIKGSFNGTEYKLELSTDRESFTTVGVVSNTSSIYIVDKQKFGNNNAGNETFLGSINLKESYININGQRWWTGADTVITNINGHRFYDIAQKEKVDELYNTNGMAWFYGVDQENERIFLPRTKWFIQPTGEITEVNTVNEAGLPNIKGSFNQIATSIKNTSANVVTGALYETARNKYIQGGTDDYSINGGFDASRSNPIYGNSTTVQPPSINQLLYICVGSTVADTSWVDVVTQVENGVKDIDDAINNGVSRLNSIDSLKTTQITNCLLEVPQRIKLELNDGVLTLKAGSQVIVPNGFEDDGVTPRFDYVTVENDLVAEGQSYTYTGNVFVIANANTASLLTERSEIMSSGTTPSNYDQYGTWYDTTTNKVKRTNDNGSTWYDGLALPIGICYYNNAIQSISQTFNDLGYIGSTVWVDKGVKGLIPNGRNEDGTLNNIEWTNDELKIRTITSNNFTGQLTFDLVGSDYNIHLRIFSSTEYLDDDTNTWVTTGTGILESGLYLTLGDITISSGVISNLQPKQPFRAVDWNDYNNTPHIVDTYQNGSSWYRVWSDGWKEQGGKTSHITVAQNQTGGLQINFLKPFKDTNYTPTMSVVDGGSGFANLQPNIVSITQTGMYLSAWGQDGSGSIAFSWYVCGY